MAYCEKCGKIIKEGANFCTNCGASLNKAPKNNGHIHFICEGTSLLLIGYKVHLTVNGEKIGDYPITRSFEVSVPIQKERTEVFVKFYVYNYKNIFTLDLNKDYYCHLIYSAITGSIRFILQDTVGNNIGYEIIK